MSDAKVYVPEMTALLGTASHFCEAVVLGAGGYGARVDRERVGAR